jgi:hypothetical protein
MKGTIRLVVGFILVLGGVGGIEADTTQVFPVDSLVWCVVGLLLMGWAARDLNKVEV